MEFHSGVKKMEFIGKWIKQIIPYALSLAINFYANGFHAQANNDSDQETRKVWDW